MAMCFVIAEVGTTYKIGRNVVLFDLMSIVGGAFKSALKKLLLLLSFEKHSVDISGFSCHSDFMRNQL